MRTEHYFFYIILSQTCNASLFVLFCFVFVVFFCFVFLHISISMRTSVANFLPIN